MDRLCFAQAVTDEPLVRRFTLRPDVGLSKQDINEVCAAVSPRRNRHVIYAQRLDASTLEVRVTNIDSWLSAYQNPIEWLNAAARSLLATHRQLATDELAA